MVIYPQNTFVFSAIFFQVTGVILCILSTVINFFQLVLYLQLDLGAWEIFYKLMKHYLQMGKSDFLYLVYFNLNLQIYLYSELISFIPVLQNSLVLSQFSNYFGENTLQKLNRKHLRAFVGGCLSANWLLCTLFVSLY